MAANQNPTQSESLQHPTNVDVDVDAAAKIAVLEWELRHSQQAYMALEERMAELTADVGHLQIAQDDDNDDKAATIQKQFHVLQAHSERLKTSCDLAIQSLKEEMVDIVQEKSRVEVDLMNQIALLDRENQQLRAERQVEEKPVVPPPPVVDPDQMLLAQKQVQASLDQVSSLTSRLEACLPPIVAVTERVLCTSSTTSSNSTTAASVMEVAFLIHEQLRMSLLLLESKLFHRLEALDVERTTTGTEWMKNDDDKDDELLKRIQTDFAMAAKAIKKSASDQFFGLRNRESTATINPALLDQLHEQVINVAVHVAQKNQLIAALQKEVASLKGDKNTHVSSPRSLSSSSPIPLLKPSKREVYTTSPEATISRMGSSCSSPIGLLAPKKNEKGASSTIVSVCSSKSKHASSGERK